MLSTLPLFYIAQSVNSDDRRARFQGLRVIMDMCIPGGDTINTDAHPRHNKELSSLAKGNIVDII